MSGEECRMLWSLGCIPLAHRCGVFIVFVVVMKQSLLATISNATG